MSQHRSSPPDDSSAAVERTVEIDAPADVVWSAITEDGVLSEWFGGDVTLEPVPGGEGRFDVGGGEVRRARVDEVERGRRLSWRWWAEDDDAGPITSVTFELTELGDATRLVVTERPILVGVPRASAVALASRLPQLRAVLAGTRGMLVRA
jgi:uncharacterized protein YndB with AHSA1/START domain